MLGTWVKNCGAKKDHRYDVSMYAELAYSYYFEYYQDIERALYYAEKAIALGDFNKKAESVLQAQKRSEEERKRLEKERKRQEEERKRQEEKRKIEDEKERKRQEEERKRQEEERKRQEEERKIEDEKERKRNNLIMVAIVTIVSVLPLLFLTYYLIAKIIWIICSIVYPILIIRKRSLGWLFLLIRFCFLVAFFGNAGYSGGNVTLFWGGLIVLFLVETICAWRRFMDV